MQNDAPVPLVPRCLCSIPRFTRRLGAGRFLLIVLLGSSGMGAAEAIDVRYQSDAGELVLALPTVGENWQKAPPSTEGDLLFPDGVQLAFLRRLGEDSPISLTVSFDIGNPTPATKQAAFLDLAEEKARLHFMDRWREGDRIWIVQEFLSPTERVLAVQTFVGPYALACLFWLDSEDDAADQDRWARQYVRAMGIRWASTPRIVRAS